MALVGARDSGAASEDPTCAARLRPLGMYVPLTARARRVSEARKRILRTLDAKILQQDDATASQAIDIVLRLVTNVRPGHSPPISPRPRAVPHRSP